MRRRPKAVPRPRNPAPDATGEPGQSETSDSAVVTVDDANFFDTTAGGYTVVDFWAPWCGPCRAFAPIFQEIARVHTGPVRFGACNVDQSPKTASLVGVRSIPTLVAFGPDGSEVGRHVGALSQRALEQVVTQLGSRI